MTQRHSDKTAAHTVNTAEDLARYLLMPLAVGNRTISNRMVLAPMAGLGHIAFRQLVTRFSGFGLLFTGICSARALPHENPGISHVFSWRPQELDHTVCQIFGAEPEIMARAARRIDREGFFGVDLNFGCAVAAICKKGCGAALLKTPDKAVSIVSAVRKAVSCPVFVKFRTGWQDDHNFPVTMARAFEDAGADALTFHPRVAPDRRSRSPRWELIGNVQNAVTIPVFGNGNLFAPEHGVRMVRETGCQGLSIGRMAVARPWIFAQWTKGFKPEPAIYMETALDMARFLRTHYDDHFALKMFKKFAPYFCANFKFSNAILKSLIRAEDMTALCDNIQHLLDPPPRTLCLPNINLFV